MNSKATSAPANRTAGYAWAVVGMLWVVACVNYLDRLILVSMRDSVKAEIAMTDAQFGLLTSIFLWVYGSMSPLGGYIADRFSRKWVIIASLGIWSLMTLLTGVVHNYPALLTMRALMGVSEAFYVPAALALVADWHRGSTRSIATGLHQSGLYTGAALGGMGGYIADSFGWRQGFVWFGVFGVAYAVVLLLFLREEKSSSTNAQTAATTTEPATEIVSITAALRALFGQRSFIVLVIYLSLAALASWGITGWLPTFLKEQFSLTQGKSGMAATGYVQLGSYAGILVGGLLSDWWVRRNVRGRLYVVVIGLCIGGPSLCLMSSTGQFAVAIVGMLLYGVARGFSDANVMPILCQIVSSKYRATGYGFLNLFSTFTGGAMIYIGGALRDAHINLSRVFIASAIGLIISGLTMLMVKPTRAEEGK